MASSVVPPLAPRTLLILSVVVWAVAIALSAALPWAFPVIVLIIVFPLVLAIPHVGRSGLATLLAGGLVTLVVAGAISLENDDGGLIADIEDEVELVIVSLGLVVVGALIAVTIRRTNDAHREVADAAVELGGELADSRRRLVQAADAERARLERDLHDGAQQRLVALGIDLRRMRSLAARADNPLEPDLSVAVDALDDAIAEMRALAHGIYPPLLEARGLRDALAAAARRAANDVTVGVDDGFGRHPRELEAALYFCAVEALANADKHAPGAHVTVSLHSPDRRLQLDVGDDGPGIDRSETGGRGLVNMHDRVAALGGAATIESSQRGVRVTAWVPTGEET